MSPVSLSVWAIIILTQCNWVNSLKLLSHPLLPSSISVPAGNFEYQKLKSVFCQLHQISTENPCATTVYSSSTFPQITQFCHFIQNLPFRLSWYPPVTHHIFTSCFSKCTPRLALYKIQFLRSSWFDSLAHLLIFLLFLFLPCSTILIFSLSRVLYDYSSLQRAIGCFLFTYAQCSIF